MNELYNSLADNWRGAILGRRATDRWAWLPWDPDGEKTLDLPPDRMHRAGQRNEGKAGGIRLTI